MLQKQERTKNNEMKVMCGPHMPVTKIKIML